MSDDPANLPEPGRKPPPTMPKSESTALANALINWFNSMEGTEASAKRNVLRSAMLKVLAKMIVDDMGPNPQVLDAHNLTLRTQTDLVHEVNETIFRRWKRKR